MGDVAQLRRARLVVALSLSMGGIMVVAATLSTLLRGPHLLAYMLAVAGILVAGSVSMLRLTHSVNVAAGTLMACCWIPVAGLIWASHGPAAPATIGLVCLPVMAFILGSRSAALAGLGFAVAQMVAVFVASRMGFPFRPIEEDPHYVTISVLAVGIVSTLLTAFVWWFDSAWRTARQEAEAARDALERANLELQSAWDTAQQASEAKGRFLANMSHELRTPLNAIIGYAELMEEEAEGEAVADLERIHQAGHYLLTLVNDVLDMSRIEANKLEVRDEAFPLTELLADTLRPLEPLAAARGNTLQLLETAPWWVRGDRRRVRQVVTNLVSNACKFTEGGRVEVQVTATGSLVSVAVVDTGRGLSEEDQQRCLLPFEQATGTDGGTGLGLAISRRLCRLMGGDLTVTSVQGVGSTFTAQLRRAPHPVEPALRPPGVQDSRQASS